MKFILRIFVLLTFVACQPKVAEVTSPFGKLEVLGSIDFGFVSTNLSQKKQIKFQNSGGASITNMIIEIRERTTFKFTGDEFPGINGTCSTYLQPAASCVVEIEMQNSTIGTWSDALTYSYNDTIEKINSETSLNGKTGLIATLKSQQGFYVISPIELNTSKTSTITITNVGELTATDLKISNLNVSKFTIEQNSCPASLPGGASCTVKIKFSSQGKGIFSDNISTSYNNGESTRVLSTQVNATAVSIEAEFIIVQEDDSKSYLNGETHSKKFKIINAGYLPGKITSLGFDNPSETTITQPCTKTTLEVEDFCEIIADFTPSVSGEFKRVLNIQYHSGKSSRLLSFPYQIIVSKAAELNYYSGVAITEYDFGSVGVGETKKISMLVKNEGEVNLESSSTFTGLSGPFSLGSTTCKNPIQLFPLNTCIVEVLYSPLAEQNDTATLSVSYSNGAKNVTKNFPITGNAANIGLLTKKLPVASEIDFGEYRLGINSSSQLITFENTGLVPLENISIIFNTNRFNYEGGSFPGTSGNCPTTLAVGQLCTISLRALSGVTGTITSTLSVRYHNALREVEKVFINLKAKIVAPAYLKVRNPITEVLIPSDVNAANPYEETFGFYSKQKLTPITVSIKNEGSKPAALSPPTLTYLSGGTNPFTSFDTTNCGPVIPAQAECIITFNFNAAASGTYKLKLTATYNNGFESVDMPEHELNFIADNLGFIEVTPETLDISTVTNKPLTQNFTIYNSGSGPASSISISRNAFSMSQFTFSHNCSNPLPAGANCTGEIIFNTAFALSWDDEFFIKYDNGGDIHNPTIPADLNFHLKTIPIALVAKSLTPAKLIVSGSSDVHDFGNVEISKTSTKTFYITNSGGMPAVIGSCTGLTTPITSTCSATIPSNVSATFTVSFKPLIAHIGNSYNQHYTIVYNNGIENKSLVLNIKGKAIAPRSTHMGWRDVFAYGSKTLGGGASVSFKWLPMTIPGSYTINKYSVYRKTASENFDISTDVPIGQITDLSNLSFTDTTVIGGTIYHYRVVPLINATNPSEPLDSNITTLRVVVPLKDMTLVHRLTANQIMCENNLSQPISYKNWNRCSYEGPGAFGSFFDIGHDLLVDVFETNTSNTNIPGILPRINLSQQGAWELCQGKSHLFAGASETLQKRLLTRKEFVIASRWNPTFDNTSIETFESGITPSANCNNTGTLEATGLNTSCVSHFGLMDAFGNAWEWTTDRLVNGITASPIGRLLQIDDYVDIDFATIEPKQTVSSFSCLAPAIGMPVPKNMYNQCDPGLIDIPLTPNQNYRNDYFFSPLGGAQGLIVGGSYSSDAMNDSGSYTSAWMTPTFQAGARCAFEIAY